MPPAIRFSREAVLNAASELIRRDGLNAFNARAVAKELGGSTQPIFRLFSCMDELKTALIKKTEDLCREQMMRRMENSDNPYLNMGISYLLFARDEPELFKLLFMRDRISDGSCHDDSPYMWVYSLISKTFSLDLATAKKLYFRTWVFTHGLAVSIATKYVPCACEKDMERLLTESLMAAASQMELDLPGQDDQFA